MTSNDLDARKGLYYVDTRGGHCNLPCKIAELLVIMLLDT